MGDLVVYNDNRNRTLVYSLGSGTQVGHAFGTPLDVSNDGALVAVQNSAGEMTVHGLPRLERVDGWQFPSEVAFARFSDDGRKLFVLTVDHTAYTLAVGPQAPTGVPPVVPADAVTTLTPR